MNYIMKVIGDKGMDRRIPVTISLPESVLRLVDEARGQVPRSRFILAIVCKATDSAREHPTSKSGHSSARRTKK